MHFENSGGNTTYMPYGEGRETGDGTGAPHVCIYEGDGQGSNFNEVQFWWFERYDFYPDGEGKGIGY